MVKSLENKNRTDRPKITVETLKETVDQCDFGNYFFYSIYFAQLFFSGNKKELSQKKIRKIILYAFFNITFLTHTKKKVNFY